MCGGTRNMTEYAYGYNVSGTICYISSQLVSKKQANQAELQGCLNLAANGQTLPKRHNRGRNSSNSAMACKAFIISVNILSFFFLLLVRFSTGLILA